MDTILTSKLLDVYCKYMHLKIFVDSTDTDLLNKYVEAINQHHLKMHNNLHHIDAGFDLFTPSKIRFTSSGVNKLDYQIACSARIVNSAESVEINNEFNTGFYMYPRSSISKSNLRLANNIGIIDAGYRGHLMGMFDVIYKNELDINKYDRHLQICAPGLIPIFVQLVNSREELGEETTRGDGGFGSTGI
jgi:dUTP pyrophosphatase